jgi:hypothetical protein
MYSFHEGQTFEANIDRASIQTNSQTSVSIDEAVFIFPAAQISGLLLARK